jgi:hypothetical protein
MSVSSKGCSSGTFVKQDFTRIMQHIFKHSQSQQSRDSIENSNEDSSGMRLCFVPSTGDYKLVSLYVLKN